MHKFNLVENAKDSLSHAIEHLGPVNKNSTGDWKRIIVDLAHVVELLVKERLRRIQIGIKGTLPFMGHLRRQRQSGQGE